MTTVIKFGTDGWRGIIAEDFTFDNVRVCAQSVASFLIDNKTAASGLVVGYDTRFASESFAAAVAEVMAANGIVTHLCERAAPTPVISFSILEKKAAGAVIITASHNPGAWNGFKYKSEYAGSASPEVVAQIEARIPAILEGGAVKRLNLGEGVKKGLIKTFDPSPPYLSHLAKLVDLEGIRRAGLKVVVDSMFGAGIGYFRRLLDGGSTEITEINGERNPLFPGIRPEPIAANLKLLCRTITESGAAVGLATDGDADRLGVVDERGQFVTQLQVFALLALYLLEVRGERGAIVKSVTTSVMMYRLGQLYNVPVLETPVGFKYIGPAMVKENALIGGEESGGYGFRGHIPERDGVLSGLCFLDLMVKMDKSPSELAAYLYDKVGPHYYDRADVDFPAERRQEIADRVAGARPKELAGTAVDRLDTTDGYRFWLVDGSWLLVRFSGTEPIIRIYAESDSPQRVAAILGAGKGIAGL